MMSSPSDDARKAKTPDTGLRMNNVALTTRKLHAENAKRVFLFSGIGNIEIYIDSLYSPEKVFKSNNDDFEIVTCHTKGYWRSIDQLIWKKGHLGGQIHVKDIGEVDIWSYEDGYYQLAVLKKDYYKPD